MGGVLSICIIIFGIGWTIIAKIISASFSMFGGMFSLIGVIVPLLGVVFIIIGIVIAVYNFKNATSKNRFSVYDITDSDREPDPLDVRFGNEAEREPRGSAEGMPEPGNFCPYCGARAEPDYAFCRKCGRAL